MKILFHYPPFLSSNSKILNALLKLFPPKRILLNAQKKKKLRQKKSEKRRGGEKAKTKVKTAVSLLNSNFEKLFVN